MTVSIMQCILIPCNENSSRFHLLVTNRRNILLLLLLLLLSFLLFDMFCKSLLHCHFVLVPPDDSLMCKPEFTKKLQDLTVNDGEHLQLTCTIKGDPEPQVNWTKNGQVCTWK